MTEQVMTIAKLKEQVDKMVAAGYGDMPISLNDDVLHEGDFVFSFIGEGGMKIRGMIYNAKDYQRLANLRRDIDKAWEKFSMNGGR